MLILLFVYVYLETWVFQFLYQVGIKIRLTIIGILYKKLLCISSSSLNELNLGKFLNVISNDVNDIDSSAMWLIIMLGGPIIAILSLIVTYKHFGIWSFFAIAIIIGCQPLQKLMANFQEKPKNEKNIVRDNRIKLINEQIENIKLLKLYAWEIKFQEKITDLRELESQKLKQSLFFEMVIKCISEGSVYLAVLVACGLYTLNGGILDSEKVYSAIFILNIA